MLMRPFFRKSAVTSDEAVTPENLAVQARAFREKFAHEHGDILERSFELKAMFPHVLTSPSIRRLEKDRLEAVEGIAGKRVLDYGCGKGDFAMRLLERNAVVYGIDISENYVEHANAQARHYGFSEARYNFHVMDAHSLNFDDNFFDLVIGNGILHHLDLDLAISEVNRVLRPGGKAVFQEPLAGNPLLKLFRYLTPKARTVDERPLSSRDLAMLDATWNAKSKYYGLITAPVAVATSLLLRRYPDNVMLRAADGMEQWISELGILRSWHQYTLLYLVKR